MKKGIFSTWFREIATIIFTQTIQAFLLAIVMSIIISALGKTAGSGDQNGSTAAAGLLAIIALSQFGKFELLIKNIFGVTSGVADTSMNAGFKGLTTGKLMVARGMRRLGDNGKKLASGIASFKTSSDIKNMNSELGKLKSEKLPGIGSENSDEKDLITKEKLNSGSGLNISNADIVEAIRAQTEEIRRQTQAQERNRQDDKISKLEEKIDEANKKRSEQRKAGLSGLAETAGAFYGGSAGLAVGLARGEEIDATVLGGMQAGDFVADVAVDGMYAGKGAVKGIAKTVTNPIKRHGNNKAIKSNVNSSLEAQTKLINELDQQIKAAEGEQQKQLIQDYNSRVEEYNKSIKSMTSDKGMKSAANKALGGNIVKRTVKNKLGINKSNYKDRMKNYDVGKDL